MKSIIAVDMKSFLFSNLISDHQLGFRSRHSTLDMLFLLSQQCMEAFNVRYEIRAVSLDISRIFDTVWHHTLLSKLSAYVIKGQLHTVWPTDFLHSRSQHGELNGILSSPLPVKVGVTQGCVLGAALFLIFINDLSRKSPLSICWWLHHLSWHLSLFRQAGCSL